MKVNHNRDISFKSFYTNNVVKKGLEFAADNGALFAASATVGFSLARPVVIFSTPYTEKENRILACAKSIVSSVIGFALMFAVSKPVAKSVKKIDANPQKYLKENTISSLQGSDKNLQNSQGYFFATQLFKLGLGAAIAIPKAILTSAATPLAANVFERPDSNKGKNPSFKSKPTEKIASGIGKIINAKSVLNFTNKFKDTNFPMHIVAGTDLLSTAAFINQTKNSKQIEENRKLPLIYNSAISTGLSIISGYTLDGLLKKPTEKIINKYKEINKADKNVEKQIQGIKIAKPILILGAAYYLLIPFISTLMAEKVCQKGSSTTKFRK